MPKNFKIVISIIWEMSLIERMGRARFFFSMPRSGNDSGVSECCLKILKKNCINKHGHKKCGDRQFIGY